MTVKTRMSKQANDVLYLFRIDFGVASDVDVSVDHLEDAVHARMVMERDSTSTTNDENSNRDVAILVDTDVCHRGGSEANSNCTPVRGRP
jgi:hypothetical protein